MPRKTTIAWIVCGFVGLVFLVGGCVLITVFHNVIHDMVKKSVPLVNGSESYKNWQNPPVPVYFQVWVFDITNPEEVVQNGAKPVLVQKGPYTYREKKVKESITINSDNSTISYREVVSYNFDFNKSVGPENDTFTTVNIPMVTVASMVRYEFDIIQELTDLLLEGAGEHLFMTYSIRDILWGYEDPLLKMVNGILTKAKLTPIDDHFGLFYQKNNSNDGLYNIYSGVTDTSVIGRIQTWNYNSSLSWWSDSNANMINGSDGTIYPPFMTRNQTLYLFVSDLCRSLYLKYDKDETVKDIPLYKFFVPDTVFGLLPENAGFCTPRNNCLPYGLLNMSTCRDGAPIVMSSPHFLFADPKVIDGVIGLKPNREEHETFLEFEPITGIAMNLAKRLQVNVYLEKVRHITDTFNIKPLVLPVLWLNESAMIDDKTAKDFKSQVQMPMKITDAIQYGLITLGAFILLCSFCYFMNTAITKMWRQGSLQEENTNLITS